MADKPLAGERILLVNDDGIHAEGIDLLERVAHSLSDDVWVVAPDTEQSGTSHSLSMLTPVRVRKIDDRHFAIRGTPTDCALLAYYELLGDRKPTILFSGINRGANLAEDMTYSGTIAAAMEGTLLGMRSVALSQIFQPGGQVRWPTAERFAGKILASLLKDQDWPANTFINVNFPDVEADQVTGIHVTTQGQRPPGSFRPLHRIDGRNVPYYWIKLDYQQGEAQRGSDLEATEGGAISVTPLHLNLTQFEYFERLGQVLAKVE